ncbi:cobyrinate a,c-diamide synthase [Haloimpatiens sp. FM7315]|uniref:cobyrinate a,c-diamide synthase n=1 Tax=Haloimpatiens sp. FM7315 TaxID=3298609 RepID=UPI00370B55D9
MKGLVIASNQSGGGKTTVTLGLMRAFMNKGFKLQPYKVGPDYIDPAFHTKITGIPCRNLDIYLMGEKGVKASFSRGKGDLAIVEGVMGLYDGKGIDSKYSTAHVAKLLNLPVVLVISPKAQMATLCAEINGLVNYDKVNIAGIILNNISETYYKMLKLSIEHNCSTKVFGYVPKEDKLRIGSRHLGLVQSSEIKDIEDKINLCSSLIEKHVDLESLVKVMEPSRDYEDKFHIENLIPGFSKGEKKKNLNIAVAYDKAFSFYYKENLELMEELSNVTYFSPLKEKKIPENTDFLYLGGGYPEVFAEDLSCNKSMLKSIRDNLNKGLYCYAECGGLQYLTEALVKDYKEEDIDYIKKAIRDLKSERSLNLEDYIKNSDNIKEFVGFFKGFSYMTSRLQNFGYAKAVVKEENQIAKALETINCHEFHRSKVLLDEKTIYKVEKNTVFGDKKSWKCGYIKKNTLGAYAHIHFFGNMKFLKLLQIRNNVLHI